MYTITANGAVLHDPNLDLSGHVCISPVLTERFNTHGSLTFSVAPTHPLFNSLKKRLTYIKCYDDGVEIWRGRILSISRGWNNAKDVYCEGELAYLTDTTIRPFYYKGSIANFLQWLLNRHNGQLAANDERAIVIGTVSVSGDVEIKSDKPQTTWEVISSQVLQKFDGYMYTSKGSLGEICLNYVDDFAEESEQEISFGSNLLSLDEDVNAADVITKMIPYGARTDVAPVLYKQRSSGSLYYDKFDSEDMEAGNFLVVANGAALNTTINATTHRAESTLVTQENNTIQLASGVTDCIWEISRKSGTTEEENEWLLKNGSNYLASTTVQGRLQLLTNNVSPFIVWKIANSDKGVTITSKRSSDKKVDAVLHGDPDNGFGLEESAKGNDRSPSSNGTYDGNRVTVKRCATIADGVHELGSDVVRSVDALAMWDDSSIVGYEIFDEADSPDKLMTLCLESLAKRFAETLSLSVRVADLSLIGKAAKRLKIGVYGRVDSELHDLHLRLLCTEKTTYFTNPEQTSTTFGAGKKTLSDLQGGLIANVS